MKCNTPLGVNPRKILSNVVSLDSAYRQRHTPEGNWPRFYENASRVFRTLFLRPWQCCHTINRAKLGDKQSIVISQSINEYLKKIAEHKCPICALCPSELHHTDDCRGFFLVLPGLDEMLTHVALMSGLCVECSRQDDAVLEQKFVVALCEMWPDAHTVSVANILDVGGRS